MEPTIFKHGSNSLNSACDLLNLDYFNNFWYYWLKNLFIFNNSVNKILTGNMIWGGVIISIKSIPLKTKLCPALYRTSPLLLNYSNMMCTENSIIENYTGAYPLQYYFKHWSNIFFPSFFILKSTCPPKKFIIVQWQRKHWKFKQQLKFEKEDGREAPW